MKIVNNAVFLIIFDSNEMAGGTELCDVVRCLDALLGPGHCVHYSFIYRNGLARDLVDGQNLDVLMGLTGSCIDTRVEISEALVKYLHGYA